MSDIRKKLKRFLSGKGSGEGKELYDAWYRSFDDTGVPEKINSADVQQELGRMKSRTIESETTRPSLLPWWRAAAAVLAIAVAGVYLYRFMGNVKQKTDDYTAYNTSTGQRRQVVLPDGTSVWLNASTELRTPKAFGEDKREVYLSGEAYFEVARDPQKPFIIHARELTTTVLGTVFNVRSYSDEELEEVAVISGKVAVASGGHKTLLTAGKKLTRVGELFSESSFDDFDHYTTWKEGKLVLENHPVNEVLKTVNRFYGVDIRVRGENLGSCLISTTLEPMPEQELVNLLCMILNAKAQKKDSTYWISGNGCNE